jgi:hypothetical protein
MGTFKSVIASAAIMAASVVLGAPAADAAPDPYNPSVSTECGVTVPTRVGPRQHVVVRLRVTANTTAECTGAIRVTIRRSGTTTVAGTAVWTRTVQYDGEPLRIRGPQLPEGSYVVTSQFKPDDAAFKKCDGRAAFTVGRGNGNDGDDNDNDNDDNGPGGLLPDTGGPAMLWLLVGVGLVGAGTVTVVHARRRQDAAIA